MAKEFMSTNSQLRILRSRGMIIKNGNRVKRILETENYYNIINGYKDLFLDKTNKLSCEKYLIDAKNFYYINPEFDKGILS